MSIASEIQRLMAVRERIYDAIYEKGGMTQEDMESPMALEKVPRMIGQIPSPSGAVVCFPDGEAPPTDITFSGEYVPTDLTVPKDYWERLTIQNGTRVICEAAFEGCFGLTEVSLADSITEIRAGAFANCSSMMLEELPRELQMIGQQAFYNCTRLETITFRGTPETIATDAFEGCYYLMTIRVPWSEGEVPDAPWGAENATVEYNAQPEM